MDDSQIRLVHEAEGVQLQRPFHVRPRFGQASHCGEEEPVEAVRVGEAGIELER